MLKKFYNLDFGLQMLIVIVSIIILNPMIKFSLLLLNTPDKSLFTYYSVLSLVLFLLQVGMIFLGAFSVVKHFKKPKN